MMNRLLSLLPCLFILPTFAGDLAPAAIDGSLWTTELRGLDKLLGNAYFAPVDKQTLRFPRQKSVEFASMNVGDLLLTLAPETKKPLKLQASVYNKGDDGVIGKDEFDTLLNSTIEKLDTITATKGKRRKMMKRDVGIKLDARVWQTDGCLILLEAAGNGSRKDFTAEFIRLSIGPDEESLERGGAQDAARRNSLRDNRKEDESGNVWIEGIPMVDQGQKGYCVPASVSRVFAYYGMDGVDQHALAALCKSSAGGGTSMQSMERALEDISRSFHMRVNPFDKGGYSEFISSYNAAARKLKKPQITAYSEPVFSPDVLLEARAGKAIQVRKWLKPIIKCIDAGMPVLWSVQLAFPEPGMQQSGGGHMRLIIGYNTEDDTIIYSDSWGAGHEKKSMPANRACAITVCRYVLRPSR